MRPFYTPFLFLLVLAALSYDSYAQKNQTTVHFKLDMSEKEAPGTYPDVGIRGNKPPLSWETTYTLSDPEGDHTFEGAIVFETTSSTDTLQYKFVYGDVTWELPNEGNRLLELTSSSIELPLQTWGKKGSVSGTDLSEAILTPDELAEDFRVLKEALHSLHPGLYRFQDEAALEARFEALKASLDKPMTYQEAYLAFSRFVPELLCGHTMVNPFNQDAAIQELIFNTSDKIPFQFQIAEDRMVVTRTASDTIQEGMEVLTINGTPVSDIMQELMLYASSDGSNSDKRLYELQLIGYSKHDLFDIYFPLLFPPTQDGYTIEAIKKGESEPVTVTAQPMSRSDRRALLEKRYGPGPASYDELWSFELLNEATGYMKLGTFATYQMSLDWQGFLKDAFATLEEQSVPNLIIDLRGNSGGMDIVGQTLLRSISTKPVTIPATEYRIAYDRVPDSIRPYIGTWDDRAYDLTSRVMDTGKGYFVEKNSTPVPKTYQPKDSPYQGRVFILIDAANSSNTFFVARTAKENKIATLVGEPTGGNLKGTNGGQMYFLNLPHSKVEVDIPIYGSFPMTEQPDEGIYPDILAKRTVADLQNGVDTILEATMKEVGR